MDSSHYGEHTKPRRSTGRGPEDGAAVRSSRLQKQRSYVAMRSDSHTQPFSGIGEDITTVRGSGAPDSGFGDGTKARKGSIRNAVKKIFGRRSRDVASQGPELSNPASRHAYHRSEPTGLVPPPEQLELFPQHDDLVERTLSYHYQAIPSPNFNRTGSPYAVQFPNSVRLKPMDLGKPLISPSNQLRRRKTLSSLVLAEREAAATAAAIAETQSAEANRRTICDAARDPTAPAASRPCNSVKKARRKSRSADDLKATPAVDHALPRKRSDEIRYWRQSFQPDVLRASGFTARSPPRDEVAEEMVFSLQNSSPETVVAEPQEDNTLMPQPVDPAPASASSRSGTVKSSPLYHPHSQSVRESSTHLSSGVGTEMSKDLEDRVAKLEAGLHNFQRSLQRLTAERNRRTIIMGGSMTTRRSSNDMRTPSMLADTLADPLEPSSYEYEYGHTMRPSTSLQPPPHLHVQTQGTLEDPFGPETPPVPTPALASAAAAASERGADSFRIPNPSQSHPPALLSAQPPMPTPSAIATQQPPVSGPSSPTSQPQQYNFRSLYQMLADERSARRKLENQLKSLRREISDLHTQVSFPSNVQSARSSYMLSGSSMRLQELLRETETSPPGTSHSPRSHQRNSGLSTGPEPVTSRFSGSESEPGLIGEYEELPTPNEAYQTPREERSTYSLRTAGFVVAKDDGNLF